MKTRELEQHIAADSGITRVQARAALRSFAEGAAEALAVGDTVRVAGLGAFRPVDGASRRVIHPATGAAVVVPARRRTRFHPGKKLRDAVGRR